MSRNSVTYTAAFKLGIFTIASLLMTGLLTVIMGHVGFGDAHEFRALFTTASQLKKGDDVRVAGVTVGQVKDVEVADGGTRALVTFTAKSDVPLTTASLAEIRYLNLVGDRYLALVRGRPGAGPLRPGATIPVQRTKPALDLTALFNGFQPLFAALDPKQVNELSLNLVRTLQGEGGTVQSLLANTASLTSSLADRDQLIGQVIGNLNTMLRTVDSRHRQLDELVTGLEKWMGQLARDRNAIGSSIHSVSQLTSLLADLLTQGRPLLKADVAQLRQLATRLAEPRNTRIVTQLLDKIPEMLTDQTRTGTYGSWYNYYLCDFKGRITLPALKGPGVQQLDKELENITFHSTAARCQQ